MRIEVEIDDVIYSAAKRLFSENIDISIILAEVLKHMVVEWVTHSEEIIKEYEGKDERVKSLVAKVLAKAKKVR